MKKSLFMLATLTLASALYAQADGGYYTREKVLELFSQYNPAILENAQQNEDYNAILESFLASYHEPETAENQYELIAIARNFDNSIRLQAVTNEYEQAVLFAHMSGQDIAPAAVQRFRQELLPIFRQIWAVTVQLREVQIDDAKALLKQIRKDKTLSAADRSSREQILQTQLDELKAQHKALQKDAGAQIVASVEQYMAQADEALVARQAEKRADQTRQTENLQIKTKNKKPVAK